MCWLYLEFVNKPSLQELQLTQTMGYPPVASSRGVPKRNLYKRLKFTQRQEKASAQAAESSPLMPLEMAPKSHKANAKDKGKSKSQVKRPDPLASAYAAAKERQAVAAAERLKLREAAVKASLDKKAYYDEVFHDASFPMLNSQLKPCRIQEKEKECDSLW